MSAPGGRDGSGTALGIGAVLAAWLMFALHDASIKLLVADLERMASAVRA